MGSKVKAVIAGIASAAMLATIAPASFAASFSEPIKVGETEISDLNKTFSTTTHTATKGIGDDLTQVAYSAPSTYPYVVEFDMTINTPLYAGSSDKSNRDSFGIGLAGTSKPGESGYFQVTGATDTTATIIWKTSNTTSLGTLNVGETYTIRMTVDATNPVTFEAYDSTGTKKISVAGLGLRNNTYNGLSMITISQNAREEGQEDSVTIDNASVYTKGPDSINLTYNGAEMSTTKATEITYDPSVDSYDFDALLQVSGTDYTDLSATLKLVDSSDPETAFDSQYISIDGTSMIIADDIPQGDYEFNIKAYALGYPDIYVLYPVKVTVGDLDPNVVLEAMMAKTGLITIGGESLELDEDSTYHVSEDLALQKGSSVLPITWECRQLENNEWAASDLIKSDGTIMPTDFTGSVKLVAAFSYKGVETTKEYPITLIDAVTEYIDPSIEAAAAVSVDDSTVTIPISDIDRLMYDITLPTSFKVADGTVTASWASDSENIVIKNDVAEIHTSDYNEHEVTLTGTFTYSKNNTDLAVKTQEYKVKVSFPNDETGVKSTDPALDKYKVRFDTEYADNFAGIPKSTSSSITLPTDGYFGSTFTWNSSVPTTISNTGIYKKPSSTKSVVMTATIMSGSVSSDTSFTITVPGTSSSGGGGGGGGGSTSSTGTSSSSKSSGSVATSSTTAIAGSTAVNGAEVVEKLLEEAAQANDAFTDISSATWAREAINGLAAVGVINGKTETEFAPNDTVTRAEFAKMLMGVFGFSSESYTTSSFRDVSADAWYFQSVETAYNLGIITGIDSGVFAPDALITRQDMAVMVSRAAAVAGKTISETNEAISFADASSISGYAVNAVDQLVKGGIINGMTDTEFAPLSNATRAQAAKILYSFL